MPGLERLFGCSILGETDGPITSESTGEFITPLTDVGSVTLQLLRLNTLERLSERRVFQELDAYPAE